MTDSRGGPAAGWYPDPAGQPMMRWWDGVRWTEHLQAAPPPAAKSVDYAYLRIGVRQEGMRTGRSIVANLFGQPALMEWSFEAHLTLPDLPEGAVCGVSFLIRAGAPPIELLSGVSRQSAQEALEFMHAGIVRDGWQTLEPRPHWYSYRYRMPADQWASLPDSSFTAPG
jgi:hypothetical protein